MSLSNGGLPPRERERERELVSHLNHVEQLTCRASMPWELLTYGRTYRTGCRFSSQDVAQDSPAPRPGLHRGAGQHALLDHLVRPRQERLRDREAYLPGSAEIEREPDLVVILDR